MKREVNIDREKHSFSVLCRVDEMRRDKQYCDFLIKVGSEEIHAHRNILAGGSDYFHAMFSHDTKENKTGVVEMLGVDPECAIICIDHIYGRKAFVPDGKDEEMIHVADLMQLHTLRDAIASMLEDDLDSKSFFLTRKIADIYGCKKLGEKCEDYLEENFLAISNEEKFHDLDSSCMKKVIQSKKFEVPEAGKLDALLRWTRYNSKRIKTLVDMVKCLDLSDIPADYRRYLVEKESLIRENNECLFLFSISVMDTMKVKCRNYESDTPTNQDSSIVIFDLISGKLLRFTPRNNTWAEMQEMNEDMKNNKFSAITSNRHIFVLMEKRSVYRLKLNDESTTWEKMADMIEEHGWYPPAVALSGRIYVVAGGAGVPRAAIEMYDITADQWTKLADKPRPSNGSEILEFNGCVYSFGGAFKRNENTVEKYDPISSSWNKIASMKEVRFGPAAVQIENEIFILGGFNSSRSSMMESYYCRTTQSSLQKSIKIPRYFCQAIIIDGNVYAIGGLGSEGSIEKYDVSADGWEMVMPLEGMKLHIKYSVKI